ncbi:aspartyl protease family protein [Flavobacteriaceae bacterium]|nr:aspartyl protease family protein [Flavobacteriaceae bacterium]
MNNIILCFFFSICFSLSLVQAQCDQPILKTISFTNGTEVESSYCGTVNDRGQRDGQGRLEYINYHITYEEGIWKNDQLNGEGKTVFTNGEEYEGVYENGQLIKGVFTSNINGDLWTYNGEFNGNNFQGVGIEKREVNNQIIIKEGDFFSDKLYQGTETVLFTNSGIKIISEYVKGISTVVNRNDINTYNAEDVVGDTEFVEVGLLQRGTVVDSRLAYDVELEINGVKGEWLLDSGAMGFTIGNIMFERLIANGVNYKDLNKKVKSFGIGGEAYGDLVILEEVKIGDYIVKNVVATVYDTPSSLLGTGFLLKFSNVIWNMKDKKLTLYK